MGRYFAEAKEMEANLWAAATVGLQPKSPIGGANE
jgi:hypothetical protein